MLLKWCRGFFFHVYHWNFAINFFLYYLTGRKFRDCVINAIKNGKKSLTTKSFTHWSSCCKVSKNLLPARTSNILLIKVITIGEPNMYNRTSSQNINSDNTVNKTIFM